ncbi:MAG: hypothetical protein MI921_20530 [Cytophagales bacterium]|nr:hypothetical protein [Cytophagales bacterium]
MIKKALKQANRNARPYLSWKEPGWWILSKQTNPCSLPAIRNVHWISSSAKIFDYDNEINR